MNQKKPTQQDLERLKQVADSLQAKLNRYEEYIDEQNYYADYRKEFAWSTGGRR